MGRAATWAFMVSPSALASSMRLMISRHWSGQRSFWATEIDTGRPVSSARARIMPNSASRSMKSETASNTPFPARPKALPIPRSSSGGAVRLGVKAPSRVRWFIVRDVENPRAPASIASCTKRHMPSTSSAVAFSWWSAPRSPMT